MGAMLEYWNWARDKAWSVEGQTPITAKDRFILGELAEICEKTWWLVDAKLFAPHMLVRVARKQQQV
jgi:hypothetical protein